jgi:hypothetical protein
MLQSFEKNKGREQPVHCDIGNRQFGLKNRILFHVEDFTETYGEQIAPRSLLA